MRRRSGRWSQAVHFLLWHLWVCSSSTTSCRSYLQLSIRIRQLPGSSHHTLHNIRNQCDTLNNVGKHALDTDLWHYSVILCPFPACLAVKEKKREFESVVCGCFAFPSWPARPADRQLSSRPLPYLYPSLSAKISPRWPPCRLPRSRMSPLLGSPCSTTTQTATACSPSSTL